MASVQSTVHESERYRRAEPERSVLYRIVAAELDGQLINLAVLDVYRTGLPKHVAREVEAYLSCGLLCRGFARVVCSKCRAAAAARFAEKARSVVLSRR